MDTETLDRLLMDRALGALSPDVETLVAAYLQHDENAAQRAREFGSAADAARDVLRESATVALPPFPAVRVQALERARHRLVWVRNAAGLAAAVVIGVGLGFGLAPRPPVERPASPPSALYAAAPPGRGFWSVSNLVNEAQAARRSPQARVMWESPVALPKLRGES